MMVNSTPNTVRSAPHTSFSAAIAVLPSTALAMGEAIQHGKLDPIMLTRQCLAAAKESDAVFISLTPERAMFEAAAAARRQAQGASLGPLDGVPIAWKDLFDIAGAVTTAGS